MIDVAMMNPRKASFLASQGYVTVFATSGQEYVTIIIPLSFAASAGAGGAPAPLPVHGLACVPAKAHSDLRLSLGAGQSACVVPSAATRPGVQLPPDVLAPFAWSFGAYGCFFCAGGLAEHRLHVPAQSLSQRPTERALF